MNTTINTTTSTAMVPYCFAAVLGNRFYLGIGAATLLMACGGTSVCDVDINNEKCVLTVQKINNKKFVFYKNSDDVTKVIKVIEVKITNRLDSEPIQVDLVKVSPPAAASKAVFTLPGITDFDPNHTYQIMLNEADLKDLAPGGYSLRFQGSSGRSPAYLTNVLLRQSLVYKPPITSSSYAGSASEFPVAEQIGFVGSNVVTINSGLNTSGDSAKQVRIYNYDMEKKVLNNPTPMGYFAFALPKETLVGFSQNNLFLLSPYMNKLLLRRCAGVTPATMAECPAVDEKTQMMVEADKALVVTADGMRVVRADPSGNLIQAATQAPLEWKAVASPATFSAAATVKAASGDLDADGKADLVALWQDGSSQQVRVFLGKDGGFGDDPVWTQRLQTGLGSGRVTALAVGDVDADGCADVVVGRGLELAVLQNQQDRFVKSWSQTISPPAGTEIAAVAVGRLAGSDPNQSLDIVTASNTPYDNSMPPVSTLYLHAFRPQ